MIYSYLWLSKKKRGREGERLNDFWQSFDDLEEDKEERNSRQKEEHIESSKVEKWYAVFEDISLNLWSRVRGSKQTECRLGGTNQKDLPPSQYVCTEPKVSVNTMTRHGF